MFDSLINKTVYIVGNEKNAGKTTFLNLALANLREKVQPAYVSIGIDGEKEDAVFGNLKPRIACKENDWIVTSENSLANGSFKIYEVFPFKTVLGRIVLVKALRDGFIELVGPEDNSQLRFIIEYLQNRLNLKTILIDGAVNRITQVSTSEKASFVHIFNITPKNIASSVDKVALIDAAVNLKVVSENLNPETSFEVDGALTQAKLNQLSDSVETVIIDDFTKIFLKYSEFKLLLESKNLHVKNKFELLYFVFNLKDIEANIFKQLIADKNIESKYYFNPFIDFMT